MKPTRQKTRPTVNNLLLELVAAINKMSNEALNQAEANNAKTLQILKGLGGQND